MTAEDPRLISRARLDDDVRFDVSLRPLRLADYIGQRHVVENLGARPIHNLVLELKPGATATEAELIAHCQQLLARFKAPKKVVFGELPKTSTGKIQKYVLREKAKSTQAIE